MGLRNLILILGFFSIIILFVQNSSAIPACAVVTNNNCAGNVVMHLSSNTNAHGELPTGTNYANDYVLCCNGFKGRNTTCQNLNDIAKSDKVVGLSAQTNAHAEVPTGTAYTNQDNFVCYTGLTSCYSLNNGNGNCGVGDTNIGLYLSSTTNAHLDGTGVYTNNICCIASASSFGFCGNNIINAGEQCDDGNTANGDGCSVTCQVENGYSCVNQSSVCTSPRNPSGICGDSKIEAPNTFGIYEQCDDGNTVSGDGCSATCQLESGYTCTGGNGISDPSVCNQTEGSPLPQSCTINELYWSLDGITPISTSNNENKLDSGQPIYLVANGTGCSFGSVKFDIWQSNLLGDKSCEDLGCPSVASANFNNDIAKTSVPWSVFYASTGSNKYYFNTTSSVISKSASPDIEVGAQNNSEWCQINQIVSCNDYSQTQCSSGTDSTGGADKCNVCSAGLGDLLGTDCRCEWDATNSQCVSVFTTARGGECSIQRDTTADPQGCADDGFYTYAWTATGTGEGWCQSGQKVLACPAKIALPFFNAYNFIAAFLIIAFIYIILAFRVKIKKELRK